jgi:dTDP-4-amino-4,6-dideoxygalactose transaminase
MIKYLPLKKINDLHDAELRSAVNRVMDSGWYLKGEATRQFEEQYANYIGSRFCIGVANGLDALTLILRAYIEMGRLKEGDEVIVPANTYIATILSITENRLIPILVEPHIDTFQIDDSLIEQAITPRTRAVMIVHLYGRCAYTEHIGNICQQHNLLLIEDNAQAHGCQFSSIASESQQTRTGSLGDAAAHSFYPGKNLGALGDAGAVTTDDEELAHIVASIGNYGSSHKYVFDYQGRNSRMDEVQAAMLSVKLKYLDADNERRRAIATHYINNVKNAILTLPTLSESVYHIFPLLCPQRDELQQYLADHGVQTVIHYPIPPHRQACYPEFNNLSLPVTEQIHAQELSLPCHPAMTEEEADTIIQLLNDFTVFFSA